MDEQTRRWITAMVDQHGDATQSLILIIEDLILSGAAGPTCIMNACERAKRDLPPERKQANDGMLQTAIGVALAWRARGY